MTSYKLLCCLTIGGKIKNFIRNTRAYKSSVLKPNNVYKKGIVLTLQVVSPVFQLMCGGNMKMKMKFQ